MNRSEFLEKWYKDIWENGKLGSVDSYFDLDADSDRLLPGHGIEPDEIREWVTIIRSFVTNIKVRLIHHVEDGNWSSALLEIRCQRIDTGAPVLVHQQIMLRFVNGLKIESYPQFDFLRFFEQIGQLPENSYALLMGGTCLR